MGAGRSEGRGGRSTKLEVVPEGYDGPNFSLLLRSRECNVERPRYFRGIGLSPVVGNESRSKGGTRGGGIVLLRRRGRIYAAVNIIYSERYYFRLDVIRTTLFSLVPLPQGTRIIARLSL